jgi:predicted MFS family arabinose efflux permease
LLAATIFLNMTSAMMLGPLLVDLSHYFHTTVALTGQLAAASAITWALTAYLAGPLSDMYGRRLMMLSGLLLIIVGTFSSALAWSYGALLACRLLTGFGAALIPPNCIATVADLYPPERRGKAMGWVISATGFGMAFGIPLVAWLTDIGGWRFPFYALGLLLVILWGLLWYGLPRVQSVTGNMATFVAHLKAVSTQRGFWPLLIANGLQVMAYIGMSGYLAAYLIQTYGMDAGETAVPLSLAGLGVIAGSLVGGRVASRRDRASVVAGAFLGGGLAAVLAFTLPVSPWLTVVLAFAVSGLLLLSWPVAAVMVTDLAGGSRATATGLFAVSNQMGILGGASLGGMMLALGRFPLVGMFCLAMATCAAGIMRYKVRRAEEGLERSAICR